MSWPPTDDDMLLMLDGASEAIFVSDHEVFGTGGSKGIFTGEPRYIERLIADGLARRLDNPNGPDRDFYCLTDRGKEAVAALKRRAAEVSSPRTSDAAGRV